MYHGKGNLRTFLHIKLRHAEMECGINRVGDRTAGDDMQFRVLFCNYDVVHLLPDFIGTDEETGLHRHSYLFARFRPDKVPMCLL